jgi:hypothetical protein
LWQRGELIGCGSFGQVHSGIDLKTGKLLFLFDGLGFLFQARLSRIITSLIKSDGILFKEIELQSKK